MSQTHDAELNAALRAALSKVMVELDAMRIMHDLEPHSGERDFTSFELATGASLGMMAKLKDGRLVVWSES